MAKEEKLQFPISGATKCPKCGHEERIGQKLIRELKEAGKLGQKAFPGETLALQISLFDPTYTPLTTNFTIPVLLVYFDICANEKCHHIYCTGINLIQQPAQVQYRSGIKGFKLTDEISR